MNQVFEVSDAKWRGIGTLADSGLSLKKESLTFDAGKFFEIDDSESREASGCICGEILRGIKTPSDCDLFKKACTPEHPVGPCMVSSEGACSAYNLYGE
jgi:hydrogenase expression/formation protein HypD